MTIKVAERLGTQPWVIDDDPAITPYEWGQRAIAAWDCEQAAAEYQRKRAARRSRRQPRGRR